VKISIVTPSYNQLDYLKLCAASVADQVGVEFEHIVQHTGNPDDLKDWVKSWKKMRLFLETDTGMYDAINRGLRRATGDICSYLNCDEQYLPGTLGKVAHFFETHPNVDVLFGDVILINQHGRPLSYRRAILPTLDHVQLVHLNTPTCATFFRRNLLDRGFYFDPKWKVIGDAVWMENLLKNKVMMATTREPLAVFTFTGKNLGATARSNLETLERQGSARRNRFKRLVAVVLHRLRKALAGAYRRRYLDIELYTTDAPNKRQRRSGYVGFGWPAI
jgi:glycosyltransferase involved in cell wall biosynthesis